MPTGEAITTVLARLSEDWMWLAICWHVYLLTFTSMLALKWRLNRRSACIALLAPLASVVLMSWLSANPFTTVILGIVLIAALLLVLRLPHEPVSLAAAPLAAAGASLLVFGLVYPHFLGSASLVTYVYAAPVGIVPCPTLSVIVGLSLILRSLGSRSWSLIIGVPALFYGIVGVGYLGVTMDWVLSAGAAILIVSSWRLQAKGDQVNVVA